MSTKRIVLLTHGGWGMSLVEALTMIIGEISIVEEIPLKPEYTFDEYYDLVAGKTEDLESESLIITDMMGGSTTNVATKLGYLKGFNVLTGLSAPLLLEAISQIQFNDSLNMKELIAAGEGSCVDPVEVLRIKLGESDDE